MSSINQRVKYTECRHCKEQVPRHQIVNHLQEFHQKCFDCEKEFTKSEINIHRSIKCDVCRYYTCNMNLHLKTHHPQHYLCELCNKYTDSETHQSEYHWCNSCNVLVYNTHNHNKRFHLIDPNEKHKIFSTHKCLVHSGSRTSIAEMKACSECKVKCYM